MEKETTMIKSAFMTSSGDPYVLRHALSFYDKVWRDEVDELWVAINSTMERDVMATLIRDIPKEIKIVYLNRRLGYGRPLNLLLDLSPEGNVLILEDDSIIFKRGVVTKYFDLLNAYDLIGSPRMSCSKEVAVKLAKEFDLNYEGWGDRGPNFWPCFLWVKKKLLLKTDRNFDPSDWGDTFAWMSVQLRRQTSNILEIPQYHCSPDDFVNREQGLGIFDGKCGYMHSGSLSSGIESYLIDDNQTPLTDREVGVACGNPQPVENSPEMQKRVMWWQHCFYKNPLGHSFDDVYQKAVNRLVDLFDVDDLDKWEKLYMEVINADNSNRELA
jgi:hypothetical protein